MSTDKLVERIADIQFDWYARLLPGGIAFVFYVYLSGHPLDYTFPHLFACFALAYLIGHAVQPLSGLLIWLLQRWIKSDQALYRRYKQQYGRDHLSSLVNKAYSEATGMFSAALLIVGVMVFLGQYSRYPALLAAYFSAMGVERVYARSRKIADLQVVLASPPAPPDAKIP